MGKGTQVIVYGSSLPNTARIWWILKYLGHENAMILDGGWELWTKQDRSIETGIREVARVPFVPKFDADRLAEIDALKEAGRSGTINVVDTRSRDEFTGEDVRGQRGGRIPGATHLEWKELVTADGRFKTRAELQDLFRKRGILPDETAVCY